MSEKRKEKRKFKKVKLVDHIASDSDENFAFIDGYTSGGAPFGLTHEEMNELIKEENLNQRKN